MMSTEDYQFKLEQKLIKEFESMFAEKTGKKVTVLVKGRRSTNSWMPKISMTELEKHLLLFISPQYPELEYSLACKSRTRSMVQIRMIFCQLVRSLGYTYEEIGKYLNRDHTTIIHNVRTSDNLVEVNDENYMELFNKITDYLKEYYKYESDETLPAVGEIQDNPKPVVLN